MLHTGVCSWCSNGRCCYCIPHSPDTTHTGLTPCTLLASTSVLVQCHGASHPATIEARWRCGEVMGGGAGGQLQPSCIRIVASASRSLQQCTRESDVPLHNVRQGVPEGAGAIPHP